MRVKYMGSKSWLALLRLWKAGVLPRRPASGPVRGVDAFEPVANLHRCYLRQDPVFLRSLLRLAGRKVDRRFYFSRLLPGTQRGRAGRRAACLYVLLRNSFSGKWGSFTQQRPLGLSSVRRMQRPPRNVTVQCQDALGYLRALPSRRGPGAALSRAGPALLLPPAAFQRTTALREGPNDYILLPVLRNGQNPARALTKLGKGFFRNKYCEYGLTAPRGAGEAGLCGQRADFAGAVRRLSQREDATESAQPTSLESRVEQ